MSKLWKEAASVIITSRISNSLSVIKLPCINATLKVNNSQNLQLPNFRLLMLKRSSKIKFMPDAYVFPGGVLDPTDYSKEWASIFKKVGIDLNDLEQFSKINGPRPPMCKLAFDSPLPNEVIYRITAIRETFEESGVLLLLDKKLVNHLKLTQFNYRPDSFPLDYHIGTRSNLMQIRHQIMKNPSEFLKLCCEMECIPNIWSLKEWSNWLTPTSFKNKRFDTLFFLVCLHEIPEVICDEKEVAEIGWFTPRELLVEQIKKNVWLPPPQVYELSRLDTFSDIQKLHELSIEREMKGCERWLPVNLGTEAEKLSLLPGDDLYPSVPDLESSDLSSLNMTLEESRQKTKNLHRFEQRGIFDIKIFTNLIPECGHVFPKIGI